MRIPEEKGENTPKPPITCVIKMKRGSLQVPIQSQTNVLNSPKIAPKTKSSRKIVPLAKVGKRRATRDLWKLVEEEKKLKDLMVEEEAKNL